MTRLLTFLALIGLLAACGDGSTIVDEETDGAVQPVDPKDFCGEGTYFDEAVGACLPAGGEEDPEPPPTEDPEPPGEEQDPVLPPEEEEEEPPACEEGEELVGEKCLPIETPEDPEEPIVCEDGKELVDDECVLVEEPNWVYLKSTEEFSSDMIRDMTMGEGCTLPYVDPSGYPSSSKYIVVRIDGDADWSNFHYTGWYYLEHPITATSGWGRYKGWHLEVNGVAAPAEASTTNPCETD